MQSVSQIVQVDTTKNVVSLDKKATIAIGNQLKQGAGYRGLFLEQSVLVDSLRLEISKREFQSIRYRDTLIPTLKALNKEQLFEIKLLRDKGILQQKIFEAELKNQKAKKWTWLGAGTLLGILSMLFFGS